MPGHKSLRGRDDEFAPNIVLHAPSPACKMPISGPTSAMSRSRVATSGGNFLHKYRTFSMLEWVFAADQEMAMNFAATD